MVCVGRAASPDYTKEHTLVCSQISEGKLQANLNQLWYWILLARNILILHDLDRYFFLVLCPLILIFQLMILYTYLTNTRLLAKPGNIFFGVVIIETCLNLLLFIFASTYSLT